MSCTTVSDYLPQRWNLPSAVAGDTFPGTGAITISVNDAAPSNALSAVTMSFTKVDALTASLVLTTDNSSLVLDDSNTWTFHIPEFNISLNAGVYNYKLETISITGQIRNYLYGSWKLI